MIEREKNEAQAFSLGDNFNIMEFWSSMGKDAEPLQKIKRTFSYLIDFLPNKQNDQKAESENVGMQ